MRQAAAAESTQAKPNLYMVTIENLDGTKKTVLKSQPLKDAVSCYELTPDQINALWFAGQADLAGDRGPIPAIMQRKIALFVPHTRANATSKILLELDEAQRERARHIALAINTPNQDFLPLDEFENLSTDDTQEIHKEKSRKQKQANYAIPNDVLDAALNGDEAIVKMMLEKNAGYLLYRCTASDFSGRQYDNLTPFQAALITGDEKMVDMMKPYFDRLQNGQAKMQKQVTEIFPNGIEANEAAQKRKSETDFAPMLEEVIAAIKNASPEDIQSVRTYDCNNSRLYLVLNKFRAAFDSLSRSEKIFNPHHLLKAFEAYVDKFDKNNSDWRNQLPLFWCQVIGFAQRFLPANYAQVFAYDLYDIVENKHPCPRSLNFRNGSSSFYPLRLSSDPRAKLGFSHAVQKGSPYMMCVQAGCHPSMFKTYVEQKQQAFKTYCATSTIDSQPPNPITSSC